MKKNKKIILLSVGGVGFFAITSVAIAIPVVLASSNSDKQIVKNAQVALEELTIDQRTVDLTKDDNKKLPSKIGTKIISMEILNGLLKKAIATLNGITYTPKVIKTNDEQGKIEVEVEIKKGVVIEIVNFTIVGFKSQVQVDGVALAKAVLDNLPNTNILNNSQSASQVSYESLDDFFEKTALDAPIGNDDIALSKVTITIADTPKGDTSQTVIFTISSKVSGASATSELEVTSFKSSLLVQKEADVAAAKAVLDSLVNTNIIDDSQTASQVSYESLDDFFEKTALDAPIGNDDIALSKVTITIADTPKGDTSQTVIFTISSKVSGASATSELEVTSFKSSLLVKEEADVAAAKAVLDSLVNTNIIDDSQTASQVSYESLDDFFEKTALDVPSEEDVIVLNKVNIVVEAVVKDNSSQTIIFTISSKSIGKTDRSTLIVNQFKEQVLAQKEVDVAAAKIVLANLPNTNILNNSQSASQVSYESLDDFFEKTALDAPTGNDDIALSKVTITIAGTPKGDNAQTVIFTISSKVSGASATSELEVTSFKSSLLVQKEADVAAAKAVLDNLPNTNILNNSQSASQVSYESLDDFFEKTALDAPIGNDDIALSKVTITIADTPKGDTSQTVIFTISSKVSGASATSELEVTSFKSQDQIDVDNELAKIESDAIKGDINKLSSKMNLELIKDLIGFPQTNNGVEFNAALKSHNDEDGTIIITLIATKNDVGENNREITIKGFKVETFEVTIRTLNNEAKTLDTSNFYYDGRNFSLVEPFSFYDDIVKISGIGLSKNTRLEASKIKAIGFTLETNEHKMGYTSQFEAFALKYELIITYTLKNDDVISDVQTLRYTGFIAKTLNDYAKGLMKYNFIYNKKCFDLSKLASTYNDVKKISGAKLDANTILIPSAIALSGDDLIITYKLRKNGKTSDEQTFKYTGFISQDQIDIDDELAKIKSDIIKDDSIELLLWEMDSKSILDFMTLSEDINGVHFSVHFITPNYVTSKLVFDLLASKNDASWASKEITISGFRTQTDYEIVEAELAKIETLLIGDTHDKFPSDLNMSILKGFNTTANGVHFSAALKSHNDEDGILTITLTAIKNTEKITKDIIISGFKSNDLVDVENELSKISSGKAIIGDRNKLPSNVNADSNALTLIAALPNFPFTKKINSVNFSFKLKGFDDSQGKLTITLLATKNDARITKEIVISGFKTQTDEAAMSDVWKNLIHNKIEGDNTKFPSEMNEASIKALKGFPQSPTTNGVEIILSSWYLNSQKSSEIILYFEITRNNHESKNLEFIIRGFKSK